MQSLMNSEHCTIPLAGLTILSEDRFLCCGNHVIADHQWLLQCPSRKGNPQGRMETKTNVQPGAVVSKLNMDALRTIALSGAFFANIADILSQVGLIVVLTDDSRTGHVLLFGGLFARSTVKKIFVPKVSSIVQNCFKFIKVNCNCQNNHQLTCGTCRTV